MLNFLLVTRLTGLQQKFIIGIVGNLFQNKRKLLARINSIQWRSGYSSNRYLLDLKQQLMSEYSRVLHREELLWFQKSRTQWNTRFYHVSIVVRQKRNKIESLKLDSGDWSIHGVFFRHLQTLASLFLNRTLICSKGQLCTRKLHRLFTP